MIQLVATRVESCLGESFLSHQLSLISFISLIGKCGQVDRANVVAILR